LLYKVIGEKESNLTYLKYWIKPSYVSESHLLPEDGYNGNLLKTNINEPYVAEAR
jgi:hypothetical protein